MDIAVGMVIVLGNAALLVGALEGVPSKPLGWPFLGLGLI